MGRGKRIRANRVKQKRQLASALRPASYDEFQLCISLESRFKDLMAAHIRIKGVALPVPTSLDKEMVLWRQQAVRFKDGDKRTNQDEVIAVRAMCQWTVDENHHLRGQEGDPPVLQWSN
jgi:hypothetical protein